MARNKNIKQPNAKKERVKQYNIFDVTNDITSSVFSDSFIEDVEKHFYNEDYQDRLITSGEMYADTNAPGLDLDRFANAFKRIPEYIVSGFSIYGGQIKATITLDNIDVKFPGCNKSPLEKAIESEFIPCLLGDPQYEIGFGNEIGKGCFIGLSDSGITVFETSRNSTCKSCTIDLNTIDEISIFIQKNWNTKVFIRGATNAFLTMIRENNSTYLEQLESSTSEILVPFLASINSKELVPIDMAIEETFKLRKGIMRTLRDDFLKELTTRGNRFNPGKPLSALLKSQFTQTVTLVTSDHRYLKLIFNSSDTRFLEWLLLKLGCDIKNDIELRHNGYLNNSNAVLGLRQGDLLAGFNVYFNIINGLAHKLSNELFDFIVTRLNKAALSKAKELNYEIKTIPGGC